MGDDMFDLDSVARQVIRNCRISDSSHAGLYSICGLAMRLRDLYKWENGLDPWVEDESSKVLEWIGRQEETWNDLTEEEFRAITISGREYDPLDVKQINHVLETHGVYYGAGYVHSLKPSFFLAVLEEKRRIGNHPIRILGRELARDLVTIPALSQDGSIIIRKAAAKVFFWDQIFYVKKSGRQALRFALEKYGIEDDLQALRPHLDRILEAELDRYIYHELGEIDDRAFDRAIWRRIIAQFPHTPIELFVRCVKDLLADTNEHGTLPYILKNRKQGMLGFYVACLGSLTREIFPEIVDGFDVFAKEGDWEAVERAVSGGSSTAIRFAGEVSDIYMRGKEKNDMEWTARTMEKAVLAPLGLAGKREVEEN
jgi:hypothetical protein